MDRGEEFSLKKLVFRWKVDYLYIYSSNGWFLQINPLSESQLLISDILLSFDLELCCAELHCILLVNNTLYYIKLLLCTALNLSVMHCNALRFTVMH